MSIIFILFQSSEGQVAVDVPAPVGIGNHEFAKFYQPAYKYQVVITPKRYEELK